MFFLVWVFFGGGGEGGGGRNGELPILYVYCFLFEIKLIKLRDNYYDALSHTDRNLVI